MRKLFTLFFILFWCCETKAATVTATPALSFLQSIGINTHLGQSGYMNLETVESQLAYVGIKKVRDGVYTAGYLPLYLQLYNDTGIQLSDPIIPNAGDSYATQLAFIRSNFQIFWQIEGCNEPDGDFPASCSWGGFTGNAAISPFQYQLLEDITPLSIPLAAPSIENESTITAIGPLPANRINLHQYLQFNYSIDGNVGNAYTMLLNSLPFFIGESPGRPYILTETGGWTVPCSNGWTQNVQAKYNLNSVFDAIIIGFIYSGIYELNDQTADPSCTTIQDHFGLFNADGTTKIAATTFHNTTTLLADTNNFVPTTLSYTFTNMPALGQSFLLQKTDGTFWLAIWNDVSIWNFTTFSEISVNPISVTLNLGITASIINVYDPLIGTTVQQTTSNASSIVLSVPDHVILVNIRP